ncbi:hypothetical protein [Clostridium pasteurianum]|uniref:Uncharacterized protein n=1 Tax=Clostridium pasteurianum BC1 TaxID=86416 RepID=R4K6V9_CLOPA|nr:hypothetical protein [Clostridium pasteurianum]AGK97426.1 hypothetical protein Clopa_2566 [Clostridium pasteurianum BC1]
MAAIRCKQCIYKNRQGNEEPCVNCNEIIDFKNVKCVTNYFKLADNDDSVDVINKSKERLRERLSIIEPIASKVFSKFTVTDKDNIILSAFIVNRHNEVIFYQLTEKDKELIENRFLLDKSLFKEFKDFYDKNIKEKE